MHKFTSHLAVAASVILLAVVPAQAQTIPTAVVNGADDVLTARVSAVGVDLNSTAGRKRFDARIRSAVRQVCPAMANETFVDTPQLIECRRAAHSSATNQTRKIIASRR